MKEVIVGSKQITRERGVAAAVAAGLDSVNDGADGLCCAVTDGSSCFLILYRRLRRRGRQEKKRSIGVLKKDRRTDGLNIFHVDCFQGKIPLAVGKIRRFFIPKTNQAPSPNISINMDVDNKQNESPKTPTQASRMETVVLPPPPPPPPLPPPSLPP